MNNNNKYILHLTVEEFQELLRNWFPKKVEPKPISSKLSELLIPQSELADIFQVSEVTIYKWGKAGILPKKIKQGGRCYYFRKDILSMLNGDKSTDDGEV